jgi:hypothetical protein
MVKPKPLDQGSDATRVRHMSYRIEKAYVGWIKRLIYYSRPALSQRNGPMAYKPIASWPFSNLAIAPTMLWEQGLA